MNILEASSGTSDLRKRAPSYARAPKDLLGNLCRLEDLFVSNSQRLNSKVRKAVVTSVMEGQKRMEPRAVERSRIQYRTVGVAGDGRCGWRAILACQDIGLFESIPRTVHGACFLATVLNKLHTTRHSKHNLPCRNQAHYPVNHHQNEEEISTSQELCKRTCTALRGVKTYSIPIYIVISVCRISGRAHAHK